MKQTWGKKCQGILLACSQTHTHIHTPSFLLHVLKQTLLCIPVATHNGLVVWTAGQEARCVCVCAEGGLILAGRASKCGCC